MTHTELTQAIQDLLCKLHKVTWTGNLIIKDLYDPSGNHEGYAVGFENYQERPVWYSATLPDEEFLKFMEKELRSAAFVQAKRSKTVRNTTTFKPNNFIG